MRNPIRRNRNIGTKKQGYGKDKEFNIPLPTACSKFFYERLGSYHKVQRNIGGVDFTFVVESTRTTAKHACSIDDLAKIILHIPQEDYGPLRLVILRQAKRKEEIFSPVWGRLIYNYEFENMLQPAIIIEAIDYSRPFKWTKKLNPEDQKELEKLRQDSHQIKEDKRCFIVEYQLEAVRNTQLYRTLLHEFGHYAHYLQTLQKLTPEQKNLEENGQLNCYFKLPKIEREQFAHRYAEKMRAQLTAMGVLPFDKIETN